MKISTPISNSTIYAPALVPTQTVATDDSTYDNVPVTCLLHAGDQMPRQSGVTA